MGLDFVRIGECKERMDDVRSEVAEQKKVVYDLQKRHWIGVGIQSGITIISTAIGVLLALWGILSSKP